MSKGLMEEGNWWADSRKELIVSLIEKYSKKEKGILCDVGCGTGAVLKALNTNTSYACIGIEKNPADAAKSKNKNLNVCVEDASTFNLDKKADIILLLDVVEHIEDDQKALSNCLQQLNKGGLIILTVPAYKFLWSEFDKKAGHIRRYSKMQLKSLLLENRLRIVFLSYWNFFLLVPVVFIRKILELSPDGDKIPAPLFLLFRFLLKIEKFLILQGLALPFGVSLVTVAVKY